MKIRFLIILILFAGNIRAQSETSATDRTVSGKVMEKKTILPPLTLMKDYHFINFYTKEWGNFGTNLTNNFPLFPVKESRFIQMKQNIALGFNVMNAARERKSLGAFGKFLGYTNAAAAVGLAAYHFAKYGWDGNKRNKKKN